MNARDIPTFALQKELLRRLRPEERIHWLTTLAFEVCRLMEQRGGPCQDPTTVMQTFKELVGEMDAHSSPAETARIAVSLAGTALWLAAGAYGPEVTTDDPR